MRESQPPPGTPITFAQQAAPLPSTEPAAPSFGPDDLLRVLAGITAVFVAFGVGTKVGVGSSTEHSFVVLLSVVVMSHVGTRPGLRTEPTATAWQSAIALVAGYGFAPLLATTGTPLDTFIQGGLVALMIVIGAASLGTLAAPDLTEWLRPASLVLLAVVLTGFVGSLRDISGYHLLEAALSASCVLLNFSMARHRGVLMSNFFWIFLLVLSVAQMS